jgi:hypothetical protein
VDFCKEFDLEAGQSGEEILTNYFKFLRLERTHIMYLIRPCCFLNCSEERAVEGRGGGGGFWFIIKYII